MGKASGDSVSGHRFHQPRGLSSGLGGLLAVVDARGKHCVQLFDPRASLVRPVSHLPTQTPGRVMHEDDQWSDGWNQGKLTEMESETKGRHE
ncbi:unnamed protein product [Protopolystoma xenopodis]|uniref:Uncharacterized protein n=1 Tax=Protopolystoma xenopodis TaxID=117903 RepID=A0A3S5CIG1_9PLAT|nr:unnamed protein product [Protopolystoma xenopodis]